MDQPPSKLVPHPVKLRKGQSLRLPERVIIRKGKEEECLQAPVRASGRVVPLCHREIGIAISHGEDAAVKDIPFQPVTDVPFYDTPDDSRLLSSGEEGKSGPERSLGEAVGQ